MTIKKLSQQIENTAHQFGVSDLENAYRSLEKIQDDLSSFLDQPTADKPPFHSFSGWFIYIHSLYQNGEFDDAQDEIERLHGALGDFLYEREQADRLRKDFGIKQNNTRYVYKDREEQLVELYKDKEVARKKKKAADSNANQTPAA